MKRYKDDNGYIWIPAPKDYPGKKYKGGRILEHHYIWWKETGKILPKGYNIHHKNGTRSDNRIENLEMLTVKDHSWCHHELTETILICAWCKKEFISKSDRRYLKYRMKKGQKNFYCCKQHHNISMKKENKNANT